MTRYRITYCGLILVPCSSVRPFTEMTGAAVSVSLLFLLSACSACYISNCPIGGKRSLMDAPQRKVSGLGFTVVRRYVYV